jgi:hypothetical protein
VQLFDEREEGTSLAAFRIALALVILYSLLSIAGAGLVGTLWTHEKYGGMRAVYGNWLVQWLGGTTPTVVWSLWLVALAACLLFLAGAAGRWGHALITFVLLHAYNALVTINPLASGGYDNLITNALWLMVFADSASTLSLRCRRRQGSWQGDALVAAWPRYLLIFQLVLMYCLTGLQKSSVVWTPMGGYGALYWVTQDPTWMRWDSAVFFAWISPLLRVATAVTWHWEQLTPLILVWYYARHTRERGGRWRERVLRWDWRKGWALIGLCLHLGILLLMNVGPFSWISMSYYLLLWTPEELTSGWRRLRGLRRRPG